MDLEKLTKSVKKTLVEGACAVISYEKINIFDVRDLNNIKLVAELDRLSYVTFSNLLWDIRKETLKEQVNTTLKLDFFDCEASISTTNIRDDFKITIKNKTSGGIIKMEKIKHWLLFTNSLLLSVISSIYAPEFFK